ncbi:MAG: hypothetical protein LQ337_008942 [Flavoplaca oasis]|nr:MAG: hypothetical protein LQ337_008942 [Flavoplaca oasis]
MVASRRSPLFATLALILLSFVCSTQARRIKRSEQELSARTNTMDLSKFQVPLSNGSTTLPSPTPGLILKAITLGQGTQNYTCAAGSTAAPVAVGANADLLDVSSLGPLIASPQTAQLFLKLLTPYLVSFDFDIIQTARVPILGKHIFDSTGVPVFDIGAKGVFKGKKTAGIAAPNAACRGPNGRGEGAVDWLALAEAPGSVGLKECYRVETAGGKAPASCGGGAARNIEVQYATQYWFFG